VQTRAEQALNDGILSLARDREGLDSLEGAVVVTRIQTGEVQAIVGGRRAGQAGFNRALSAHRPIGSLIKPLVFLAAVESADYSMASLVEDRPITVELDTGQTWSPANFEGSGEGQVTLVEALARSLNLATVHVGLDVGVDSVIDVLQRLGFDRDIRPYPSLLLGAVEMSPVMVAQLYSGLANEGFRVPLRTVREVIDQSGQAVTRYGIELSQTLDREVVSQINSGLSQGMARGTGRNAGRYLPGGLDVAGKSGTSDDFRDSWFAGFTGDNVVVVWLGRDDSTTTGLTGSTGALPIWSEVVREIGGSGFKRSQMDGVVDVWIDYETGELATEHCGDAVSVTVPANIRLRVNSRCDVQRRNVAERALDWIKRLGDD
jgi:penicillin-binding protein 1B